MAISLVAWPTDNANSYVSQADATVYFSGRLSASEWDDASSDDKNRALISATRMIDRQTWEGTPTETDQDLAWPRTGVTDKYGNAMADDELPADFILGVYELALALLKDETLEDATVAGDNTKRVRADKVEVEFFRPTLGLFGRFPQVINELLAQFLGGNASATDGLTSGTDRESYFDDDANSFGMLDVLP